MSLTRYPDLFADLAERFPKEDLKEFTKGGTKLTYVTARTVMNRLDDVLGPENWWDEYESTAESVVCRLSIRLPDGSIVTKVDAGGGAGMKDAGDDEKSAFSDAFKRAAVKFGVSRYLYRDGVPQFVRDHFAGNGNGNGQQRTGAGPHAARPRWGNPGVPLNGPAMVELIEGLTGKYDVPVAAFVSDWAAEHGFPSDVNEWSDADVLKCWTEFDFAGLSAATVNA